MHQISDVRLFAYLLSLDVGLHQFLDMWVEELLTVLGELVLEAYEDLLYDHLPGLWCVDTSKRQGEHVSSHMALGLQCLDLLDGSHSVGQVA